MHSLQLNIENVIIDRQITSDEVKGLTEQEQKVLSDLIGKDVTTMEDGDIIELGNEYDELVNKAGETLSEASALTDKRLKQLHKLGKRDGMANCFYLPGVFPLGAALPTAVVAGIQRIAKHADAAKKTIWGAGALLVTGLAFIGIGAAIQGISHKKDAKIAKQMNELTLNSLNPHVYDEAPIRTN